ncbi:hypothetical protein BDP81DRAFT_94992 [Colletotrichum phormii]|uniref:Uncharacterized protein n=1 Tax=Colletotrichum phormii TaxID=359342 RepID=A0AAI9ZIM6_9PEZI|nr:uncharacterized protein BDP81DRAFT_94992 [Colletotrichum phormii]KAK1625298.1 hypothetical protein BDP81DRAFT_94992 [Colletotrichum phormii]
MLRLGHVCILIDTQSIAKKKKGYKKNTDITHLIPPYLIVPNLFEISITPYGYAVSFSAQLFQSSPPQSERREDETNYIRARDSDLKWLACEGHCFHCECRILSQLENSLHLHRIGKTMIDFKLLSTQSGRECIASCRGWIATQAGTRWYPLAGIDHLSN